MRLIDADKLRYKDMSNGQAPGGVWYLFLEDVQKTPTVEVIPIEWLIDYETKNGQEVRLQSAIEEWKEKQAEEFEKKLCDEWGVPYE